MCILVLIVHHDNRCNVILIALQFCAFFFHLYTKRKSSVITSLQRVIERYVSVEWNCVIKGALVCDRRINWLSDVISQG